jgi:hypothetical protein
MHPHARPLTLPSRPAHAMAMREACAGAAGTGRARAACAGPAVTDFQICQLGIWQMSGNGAGSPHHKACTKKGAYFVVGKAYVLKQPFFISRAARAHPRPQLLHATLLPLTALLQAQTLYQESSKCAVNGCTETGLIRFARCARTPAARASACNPPHVACVTTCADAVSRKRQVPTPWGVGQKALALARSYRAPRAAGWYYYPIDQPCELLLPPRAPDGS